MVAGDLHGNDVFTCQYLYPTARGLGCQAIVQVGDFGYWEHTPDGVEFLDAVNRSAEDADIPMYWLRGNHDNAALLMARYGGDRDGEGFIPVRARLRYIPDGHVWTWAGVRMRAFGGAYSIDKRWRLDLEAKRYRQAAAKEDARRRAGRQPKPIPSTAGTLWFPEEELSDRAYERLLAEDVGRVDVMFSHDKPASADPGIPLKDEPECRRNQQWLQRALTHHQPRLWLHGHLHTFYTGTVRCGDDGGGGGFTDVIGLSCDDQAAPRFWRPHQSWCLLDLDDGLVTVTYGWQAQDLVPQEAYEEWR